MIYIFDRAMRRYPWRWGLLWSLAILPLLGLSAVSQHPLHWIISHLTYDPVSGFFRLMIWDAAFEKIGQSPLVGYGFHLLGNDILDATVDSVWLVYALRSGLPAVALLVLVSMAAWRAVPHKPSGHPVIVVMERMSTGFTMVLGMFMFVGLTVHFWNYMWIFWGICIGTRASVREWFLTYAR
jgi:succinate dehydrogenase hydrophobic anchor subunit